MARYFGKCHTAISQIKTSNQNKKLIRLVSSSLLLKQDIDTAFKPGIFKAGKVEKDKAKQLLADDIDPTEHKNKENKYEQKDLFKVVAADYISEKQDTTPKNVKKLQGFLSTSILKHIDDYPITAILLRTLFKLA